MNIRTPLALALLSVSLASCGGDIPVPPAPKLDPNVTFGIVPLPAVQLRRGGMGSVTIEIQRKDPKGDVKIEFAHLPKGVDLVETNVPLVKNKAMYNLRASATADLVENFGSEVTATGPGGVSTKARLAISVLDRQ
jgi:hypothetical protein